MIFLLPLPKQLEKNLIDFLLRAYYCQVECRRHRVFMTSLQTIKTIFLDSKLHLKKMFMIPRGELHSQDNRQDSVKIPLQKEEKVSMMCHHQSSKTVKAYRM